MIGARQRCTVEAIVDTGFDGDLSLPVQIAVQLGLELYSIQPFELADGIVKNQLVFSTEFGGTKRLAEITLTESEDALIGSGLFEGMVLEIDYLSREVRLRPGR